MATKSHDDRPSTRLLHAGRPSTGWVNTPVTRASTFTYDSVAQLRETRARRDTERVISYGARGTDSTHALEDAVVELEAGHGARLFPTGQAAIAITLLAYLSAGDHVLVSDAVYEPVRKFCAAHLSRLGIEATFYSPDGSDLAAKMRANTRMIYLECPGSLAYEMLDLPAVAALARQQHDCLVVADNTWGSGLLYRPLELGADVSVLAATKYLGGHADLVMGAVVTNQRAWPALERASISLGQTVGADDAFLVLRGIRTLGVRLKAHEASALKIAAWLQTRPEIERVLCPALPGDPNHALWQRDCHGTNGLLSVEFVAAVSSDAADRFVDALRLFGLGASWGGFESLAIPVDMKRARTVADWSARGAVVRLHIGLEDTDDLIADLEQALTIAGAARIPSV